MISSWAFFVADFLTDFKSIIIQCTQSRRWSGIVATLGGPLNRQETIMGLFDFKNRMMTLSHIEERFPAAHTVKRLM